MPKKCTVGGWSIYIVSTKYYNKLLLISKKYFSCYGRKLQSLNDPFNKIIYYGYCIPTNTKLVFKLFLFLFKYL